MPSVWLIEDNPTFRRALEFAVLARPEMNPSRAFERCEDALELLAAGTKPDVVLIDVGLPGIDGIEGARQIKRTHPEVCILVLTVFEDDERIFNAICAGACGYLLKSEPMATVIAAIEQALTGGAPMNPRVARRVLEMFAQSNVRKDYGLTDRERHVVELMVQGLPKKAIADELDLKLHHVDYTMRCIYRKLHVNCVAAAVSVAVRDHLVPAASARAAVRKY